MARQRSRVPARRDSEVDVTLKALESMTAFFADGINSGGWLDSLGEDLQQRIGALVESGGQPAKTVKDFLHGTWYGHPFHPAIMLLPAGAWTTAAMLDLIGAEDGADAAIGIGLVGSLPTAAAGLADWNYTSGKTRRLGLSHALLNTAALGCYLGSWAARKADSRGLGIGLSSLGFGTLLVSAYLGGEISYSLGQGVNRNAWSPEVGETSPEVERFQVAASIAGLAEGKLTAAEISVDGTTIPLVLLKRGGEVFALNGVCAHMGGPLAEGKLVDGDCVECPWHGSRFNFHDGSVVQGPSAYPQPRFETRVRDGNVEVRLASGQ
jgi:nitrite reductase/ring-hydroxylating ferredoxin subunit